MRFAVADDQTLYREGTRAQIERLLEDAIVEEFGNVAELLARLENTDELFDILLLNIFMPGMSTSVLSDISTQFPNIPVAITSVPPEMDVIRVCVAAGARGFIPRTATGEQLVHTMRLLLAGGTTIPAAMLFPQENTDGAGSTLAQADVGNPATDWVTGLTERERAVVRGVVRGESNKEIARSLGVAEVTVKFHLRVLFRKIGVGGRAQLAAAAAVAGLT